MKICPKTLMISDFTQEEADSMLEWSAQVILGPPPSLHREAWPPWLKQWMEAADLDDRQALLAISSIVPARVLLSILMTKSG